MRKSMFLKQIWLNGKLISPAMLTLLELGNRNNGQITYGMINVIREMKYRNSTAKLMKRLIRNGLIDENWKITEEGYKIIKEAKRRMGSKYKEFFDAIDNKDYKLAEELWNQVVNGNKNGGGKRMKDINEPNTHELYAEYKEIAEKLREKVELINDYGELNDVIRNLKTMFILQVKLNKFIRRVRKPPTEIGLVLAMHSELAELVNEFKPKWAWWVPNRAIDPYNVKEEFIDFMHFYLSYLQKSVGADDIDKVNPISYKGSSYDEEVENVLSNIDAERPLSFDEFFECLNDTFGAVSSRDVREILVPVSKIMSFLFVKPEDMFREYVKKSFTNYIRQTKKGRYMTSLTLDDLKNYFRKELRSLL